MPIGLRNWFAKHSKITNGGTRIPVPKRHTGISRLFLLRFSLSTLNLFKKLFGRRFSASVDIEIRLWRSKFARYHGESLDCRE